MKKKSYIRKIFFGLFALPFNLVATVLSYFVVIGIRAHELGKKKHIKLEALEKGTYIKRIK
jgi:hypothetical protein